MTQWGLDTLFNPAKRHMDEEKRRLQSTREEVGDNSGGKRIDLESGKVRISKGDRAAEDEAGDEAGDEAAVDEQPAAPEKKKAADKPAPSAAAIRAAERRKRKSG